MAATASRQQLGTYLNDHLGGATAGVAMARQLQRHVQGEPDADILGPLAQEIEDDLQTLRRLVTRIGSTPNPVKQLIGWVGEKVQRLGVAEMTARDPAPLRRLRAVESLSLGVEGKLGLWLALIEIAPAHPRLAELDLQRLAERARDQRRRLETVRLDVARRALAPND